MKHFYVAIMTRLQIQVFFPKPGRAGWTSLGRFAKKMMPIVKMFNFENVFRPPQKTSCS